MKHTSLYLDHELLAEAATVLGTEGATHTVRAALEQVVRRERLASLAGWEVGAELDEPEATRPAPASGLP